MWCGTNYGYILGIAAIVIQFVSFDLGEVYSFTNYAKGNLTKDLYVNGFKNANPKLCPEKGKDISLFIMVISNPKHFSHRIAIRKTWGSFSNRSDIKMGFLIGFVTNITLDKLLDAESYLYHDIIRSKNLDVYNFLTLKCISALEWIQTYCFNAEFYAKIDDDMFIHVPKMLSIAKRQSNGRKRLIFGKVMWGRYGPERNPNFTNYVSRDEYFLDTYPPYTTGAAYIMHVSTVIELSKASMLNVYYKFEDVYITGLLAYNLGIEVDTIPNLAAFPSNISFCDAVMSTGTGIHPPQLYGIWYVYLNYMKFCRGRINKEHIYFRNKSELQLWMFDYMKPSFKLL